MTTQIIHIIPTVLCVHSTVHSTRPCYLTLFSTSGCLTSYDNSLKLNRNTLDLQ